MRVVIDDGAYVPERAHPADAGLDLRTPRKVHVAAGCSTVIDTGVHVEIPWGYVGMLKAKSGLNVKYGLVGEGVIDSGYTGSVKVKLYNRSHADRTLEAGDKVIQLVVMPCLLCDVEVADSLPDSERGEGGFGSTGR